MEDLKKSIIEKIEAAFADMDAHSYNGYTDESEYILTLTVAELRWLNENLDWSD